MTEMVTRTGLKRIAILTCVVLICLVVYYPYSPRGRQAREVRLTESHDEMLNDRLALDPRFQQVTVYTCVGEATLLEVDGHVKTWADGQALVDLVWDSSPPVAVKWSVSLSMTSLVAMTSLTGTLTQTDVIAGTNTPR